MSTTTNLGLFKHDNPATNTEQFNVDKALNQNWDKIDNGIEKDRDRISLLEASNTIYNFKGKVDTLDNLQTKTKTQGDVWYCEKDSTYYAYNGTEWIPVNLNLKLGVIDELKEKTIKCLQEVETPTPKSGETIDISDSAEAKCELKIRGNSKQETRDGKNLFDLKNYFNNINIVNCTSKTLLENGIQLNFEAEADAYCGNAIAQNSVLTESYQKACIKVKPNTTYTLQMSSAPKCYISCLDSNYTGTEDYIKLPNTYEKLTYTFTTNSTTEYIILRFGIKDKNYTTYAFTDIQLEEGSIATDYEEYGASPSPDYPSEVKCCGDNGSINEIIDNGLKTTDINYKSQNYTIPTQQPFRAIGDYKDTFIKKNNKLYERHYISRKIFNGTESWTYETTGRLKITISDIKNVSTIRTTDILSSHFKASTSSNPETAFHYEDRLYFYPNSEINSLSDWNTYLIKQYNAGTPVYVDCVLETPTDIECTEDQSTILFDIEQNAKTYDKVTHICSTDEVSSNVEVTYKKDIETLFANILVESGV